MEPFIKRADQNELRKIFEDFATVERGGKKYMTYNDFMFTFLGLFAKPNQECSSESPDKLAKTVDRDQDGLISFDDFVKTEETLCSPKAFNQIMFGVFDKGTGYVTYDSFIATTTKNPRFEKIKFDSDSLLINYYFGKEKTKKLDYNEFCHFMKEFRDDYLHEAFKHVDVQGSGYIPCSEFEKIAVTMRGHIISNTVNKYFKMICADENKISFAYHNAFHTLLDDMELVKLIYLKATNNDKTKTINKDKFYFTMQQMQHITSYEIDILFQMISKVSSSNGITWKDLHAVAPQFYFNKIRRMCENDVITITGDEVQRRTIVMKVGESAYRFLLGSIAGALGAFSVYPIDLVKTRIQNQRSLVYKNSWDCFKQTLAKEGVLGLYRGLLPQIMGVAPEKAIKLSVNEFMRDRFYDHKGNIPFYGEVISGACAGICQDLVSNPLEIVKIRLQVAGEQNQTLGLVNIVKELGIRGLYKGVQACVLRDANFSAIYFPCYAHLKIAFANEQGYNTPLSLLTAGSVAAIPAVFIVTPADVIKTRLQVIPREGQTVYHGIVDCARKIHQEEGFKAFWKGAGMRVLRSSPQFGVTLLTYEILHRMFHVDFGGRPIGGSIPTEFYEDAESPLKHHIGGYSVGRIMFHSVAARLGLCLETPPS